MIGSKDTKWETEVAEKRLTGRHMLAKSSAQARRERASELTKTAKLIEKELTRGKYLPQLNPPEIEIAWIVGSRLAWLGPDEPPEGVWADLIFTDPAKIIAAEKEGPDAETDIPEETLRLLCKILKDLESFGYKIAEKEYSKNWRGPATGSTVSEKKYPKGGSKPAGSAKKDGNGRGKKPSEWKYKKRLNTGGKPGSSKQILNDFFELTQTN